MATNKELTERVQKLEEDVAALMGQETSPQASGTETPDHTPEASTGESGGQSGKASSPGGRKKKKA